MFCILSVLRLCSASQRASDKTFLADSHAVKESIWLFPTRSVRLAGFFRIAELAQGLGIEAQLEFTPLATRHLISASVVYLSYYLCLSVSSLKAGFISNAPLCPVSRRVRTWHMIGAR